MYFRDYLSEKLQMNMQVHNERDDKNGNYVSNEIR